MQVQNQVIHDNAQAAAAIAGIRLANGAAIDAPGQGRFIGRRLAHTFSSELILPQDYLSAMEILWRKHEENTRFARGNGAVSHHFFPNSPSNFHTAAAYW
jgi:hypothetical protein